MLVLFLKAFLTVYFMSTSAFCVLNFRSSTSSIKVVEGASFHLEQEISDCRGKIVRDRDAFIEGQDIVFNKGMFEDAGNRMEIFGSFKTGSTNKISLNGSKTFRGRGAATSQVIEVSGNNNRLEGEVNLGRNLIILDSNSSVTCAITRSLSQNIELNGGKLALEENLSFIDEKKILGNGTVLCNGRKLILGSKEMIWNGSIYFDNGNDIEIKSTLHLAQTWTFSGSDNTIIGNGNILCLEPNGKIVIERGSKLRLKNIVVQNISDQSVCCMDNSGCFEFQDVVLVQSDKFAFDQGTFDVYGFLELTGSNTFVLQPSGPCTIRAGSTLYVDRNMTFSVDFVTTMTNLLVFENNQSRLQLNNAELHVTSTGMLLATGKLIAKGTSFVSVGIINDEFTGRQIENGLQIGDLAENRDFSVEVTPGSRLIFNNGWLIYKNIKNNSWSMKNNSSILQMNNASTLKLYQPLDISPGTIRLADRSSFIQVSGNYLLGNLEIFRQ